jgi:hypothetical protein
MSAREDRNAGRAQIRSAMTCSDTVLPVPVAPVTRPWRLASPSVSHACSSPLPTENLVVGVAELAVLCGHASL